MRCVWAALCGIALLMQVIMTNSQTTDSPVVDCSQFNSCDSCISGDPALNLTRCVWQSCNDEEGGAINAYGCFSIPRTQRVDSCSCGDRSCQVTSGERTRETARTENTSCEK